MDRFIRDFTRRQYMVTPDYEFFHYADTSTTEIEFHNHDFYEIFCLISGNVTYVAEGRSYTLAPGDIMLIDDKDLHRPFVDPGQPYERMVIWIDPGYLRRESEGMSDLTTCFESKQANGSRLLAAAADDRELIWNKLWAFERACNSISYGNDILKKLYLIELVVYINRVFIQAFGDVHATRVNSNEKIDEIIRYIAANLDQELTLDRMSSEFYISKYHLIRLFKQYTGYSLHKYILEKRLIQAKALLREGKNVSETALACGFRDYSNFVRAFTRTAGLSPKKYFKQIVNKTEVG